jgi:hypothetical protein
MIPKGNYGFVSFQEGGIASRDARQPSRGQECPRHILPCYSAPMTLQQFRDSVSSDQPPRELGFALAGLWWEAKGNWTRAHESAQQDDGPAGAWVHAYLHRKEGDTSNAEYWYGRAGKTYARTSFPEEWEEITQTLLG